MNVKITCSEASQDQCDLDLREDHIVAQEWKAMHNAADPEPGRLVREVWSAAENLAIGVGMGWDLEGVLAQYQSAHEAALANPIAREFLEGTE